MEQDKKTNSIVRMGEFNEGLAPVQLQDGKWSYINKNGVLWDLRFNKCYPFEDGYAKVETSLFQTRYVSLKGDLLTEEEYCNIIKSTSAFHDGYARVQFRNGFESYIDQDGNLWKQKFLDCTDFSDGVARVTLLDSERSEAYVDTNQNIYAGNEKALLDKMYNSPRVFLDLSTDTFKNEAFINMCVKILKKSLTESVKKLETEIVPEDLMRITNNFFQDVKAKIEREKNTILEEKRKVQQSQKIKDETLSVIQDFEI